jgi:hypothetical protein
VDPDLRSIVASRRTAGTKSHWVRFGHGRSRPIRGFRLPGEGAHSEQFRDAPRDRETRGQAWRFYAKQVDQASDPVFVLSLDQEIGR